MEHSQAVCFRLLTGDLAKVGHHCSLCIFFHSQDNECQHTRPESALARTATPFSDSSFYTCRSTASTISASSISSGSSSSTIKARVRSITDLKEHTLRRRQSPTEMSLRELHRQQAKHTDLRRRQSEEELQAVYERQILEYLSSNVSFNTHYGEAN